MSTNSVIALPLDNGFKGRYAHWDGYPTWMGRALWEIVKRDGIDRARAVLIDQYRGWSRVGPDLDDDRVNVPGYGQGYVNEPDEWWTHEDTDGPVEWVYVLNDKHLSVLMPVDGTRWEHVGDVDYGVELTEDALRVIECGENYERCKHYAWAHVAGLDTSDRRSMGEYLRAPFEKEIQ